MTKDTAHVRRNSLTFRANSLNLLIFLTGVILGCLLIYFGSTEDDLKLDWIQEPIYLSKNTELFWEVLLTDGKFLLLLYLLAFMRPGALLTPTLFGWEGILWGTTAAAVAAEMGTRGLVLLALLFLFRLGILLPYGFLLGAWSVGQSLAYGSASAADRKTRMVVLLVTIAVLVIASFLECTLAQWLARIYFLKVGV